MQSSWLVVVETLPPVSSVSQPTWDRPTNAVQDRQGMLMNVLSTFHSFWRQIRVDTMIVLGPFSSFLFPSVGEKRKVATFRCISYPRYAARGRTVTTQVLTGTAAHWRFGGSRITVVYCTSTGYWLADGWEEPCPTHILLISFAPFLHMLNFEDPLEGGVTLVSPVRGTPSKFSCVANDTVNDL